MANLLHCKIIYGKHKEIHLCQILAGFEMLKTQKKLSYQVEYNPKYIKETYIHTATIEVKINNEYVVCYDLADGYHSFHNLDYFDNILNNVNFYFKRSSSISINKLLTNKEKIKPLGLNYFVSCRNNRYDKFINTGTTLNEKIKNYLEYLRYYKRFESEFYYNKFENKPVNSLKDYKLLYNVRLYDSSIISLKGIQTAYPSLNSQKSEQVYTTWKNDLETITSQRLELVTALKDNFGSQFIGGISRDDYSVKTAPNLILPDELSHKFNYVKMIKQNFICIASKGLHKSIGWKLGEYVAASRAILTDPLEYELPGNFTENNNFLVYNSSKELIEKAKILLTNYDIIHELENNNYKYYNKYVKPDRMVANTLHYLGFNI